MKAVNLVISSAVHGDPRASMGKDSTGLADIFDESVSGRANVKESALLSLFLSAPFIPPAQLSTGLKTLLEMKLDPSERERVSPLILKFLDVFELSSAVAGMEGSKEDIRLSVETIRALVNEWVKTSELERGVVSSSVRERIERLLASFLDKESILSTFVQIALRDHPVDSIIVRCIEGSGEKRLLSSLIETDTLRFGREFFKCLVSMPADGQEQFENGSFDRPMFLFLRSDLEIENEDTFSRWKNSIVSRTVRSLPLWASTNDSPSYLSNTVSLLLDLMRLDAIGASMLGSLAAPLASFVKNKVRTQHLEQGVIPAPTATVLECSVLLCWLDSSEISMTLSSESLLCLCELIPRSLRYHVRGKSSGKVSYLPTPAKILQWTLKLLDRVERYDPGSFISSGGSAFTTMIRSCLRYGLTREKSSLSPETSQLCIRTVKSFVETVSNDSEDWIQLYPSSSLAVPVAEMLTSHSQFHSTLCEAPDSILKLESIKLLLACYESIENPDFDLSLWKTLLQSFYAGVGETDLSIRQLLFKFGSMVRIITSPELQSGVPVSQFFFSSGKGSDENGPIAMGRSNRRFFFSRSVGLACQRHRYISHQFYTARLPGK